MKVKILFATALSLFVFTKPTAHSKEISSLSSLEGLSIGGQFGYITQNTKVRQKFLFPPFYHKNKNMGGEGIIGGLNLAWGYIFSNHFFLGIDAKGELSNLDGKFAEGAFDVFQNQTHAKLKNTFGGGLKIGGIVSSVLPYIRVGVVSSEWRSSSILIISGNKGFRDKRKNALGIEASVGIDVPLTENIAFGLVFNHVEYLKFNYNVIIHDNIPHTSGPCNCPPLLTTKIRPRTSAILLSVKYRLL